MKKRLQGMIAGVLIGATITGSAVLAVSTTTLYDVIANGVKIAVDGQMLNPTDANGNTVEPIIYNGTTYLPVRAVAKALGKAVYWDGPNYTVYLGDMDGALEYPTVMLEDMTSIGDNPGEADRLTDNYGNTYVHAIKYYYSPLNPEYLLNMKYSKFKGILYVPNGEKSDRTCYLTIVADGKTIYKSPEMNKASAPVKIDVNVTGYNDVKFNFYGHTYGYDDLTLCLGNAGFYQ